MYIGPNRMFLHYPLRKNTPMNVVAISWQPRWEQEGWAISATVGELLRKSILGNTRTRCKAPILSISARGEVPTTSVCSDAIQRPCQSEQAEPAAFL
jgi:hypothetical protein